MPEASCDFPGQPDMLARIGPTLPVLVGFDPQYDPLLNSLPNLPPEQVPALVDTGTMECCLDSELAEILGLPIVDRRSISGAHGRAPVNVHSAQLYIPALGIAVSGSFAAVHLAAGGQPYGAIIGRSVLRNLKMTYDGATGRVTLEH